VNETILEVKELVKRYHGRTVVDHLSFEVKQGEIFGLLGANGAGKTTAFYMTVGLIRPDHGKIIFKKQDVTHKPLYQRSLMGMGYLAQEPSVFKQLTVAENLRLVLETLHLSKKEEDAKLEELLAELHLEPLAKKKAGALSGGERRRLEITRALITSPSCLLLDEPFANIDPLSIYEVQQLVRQLSKRGIAILITDHNAREIFSIASRCALVQEGKLLLSGTVDDLVKNDLARTHYLGHSFTL
jgi:lipopolysaccharide export system ATP-binding protein